MLPTTTTAVSTDFAAATAESTPLVSTSRENFVAASGVAAPIVTVPSLPTTAYLFGPNQDSLTSFPAYSST